VVILTKLEMPYSTRTPCAGDQALPPTPAAGAFRLQPSGERQNEAIPALGLAAPSTGSHVGLCAGLRLLVEIYAIITLAYASAPRLRDPYKSCISSPWSLHFFVRKED
jgi:hypothetical protein